MHNVIEKVFPLQVIPFRLHYEKLISLYIQTSQILLMYSVHFTSTVTHILVLSKERDKFVKKAF